MFLTGLTVLSCLTNATRYIVKVLDKYSSCIYTLCYLQFYLQAKNYYSYKMGVVKQINFKNWTYYFYNDIINLKYFESNLLKIDRKSYKNIGIYNIGYITIKKIDDCKNIYSVNPLYLIIAHASGYIEEKNENKYLIFDSTDENKELLKKYNDVWNGIKTKSKKWAMVSVFMKKVIWKLNLILTIPYH